MNTTDAMERVTTKQAASELNMDLETLQKLRQDIYTKDNTRSKSIGLYNINQRLLLCYGSSYGLKIDSIQGCGTSVSMNIPLKTQE